MLNKPEISQKVIFSSQINRAYLDAVGRHTAEIEPPSAHSNRPLSFSFRLPTITKLKERNFDKTLFFLSVKASQEMKKRVINTSISSQWINKGKETKNMFFALIKFSL